MESSFDGLIQSASTRWVVPFAWIKAVIGTESNFDVWAQRSEPQISDQSIGLMQLLTQTARGLGFYGSVDDLYDPATNIELGTKLLSQLIARHGFNFRNVYSAYNSGSPTRWQTSSQVLHNVERAEDWLSRVLEENPGTAVAVASGAGLLILALIFFFLKRG